MAKILSKFGEQHLVMANYACGFNQSETGKYFEWIIIYFHVVRHANLVEWLSCILWFNMIYIHLNWQCLSLCSLLFSVSILTLFPPMAREYYLFMSTGGQIFECERALRSRKQLRKAVICPQGIDTKLAFLAFSTPWCPIGMLYVQLLPQTWRNQTRAVLLTRGFVKVDPITKKLGTIKSREKVKIGLYSWLALSRSRKII